MSRPSLAVGVMAHNEERTIREALIAILDQTLQSAELISVAVVSSASTDRTDAIVREVAALDARVSLLTQAERAGKISADNLFFRNFQSDYYALVNADVILQPRALEALVGPLHDPGVGIVGARVVPRVVEGAEGRFFDFANRLLWEVHHRIVLENPKMGEAVAFRRMVEEIPEAAIADEAYLEATATERGLQVVYAADSVAFAGCPVVLADYFSVRRRNTCAHELLHQTTGHRVATLTGRPIVRALIELIDCRLRGSYGRMAEGDRVRSIVRDLRAGVWTLAVVALEVAARAAGTYDARINPVRHQRWRMARSAREHR